MQKLGISWALKSLKNIPYKSVPYDIDWLIRGLYLGHVICLNQ